MITKDSFQGNNLDSLLHCNVKDLKVAVFLDILEKNNVYVFCCNSKHKQKISEIILESQQSNSLLLQCKKQLDFLEERIEELTQIHRKKHDEKDLQYCYKLIEENLFINSNVIKKDTFLNSRYPDSIRRIRLYDALLREYKDLTKESIGQGGRIHVFKSMEREKVHHTLKVQQKNNTISGKQDTYESIKNWIEEQSLTLNGMKVASLYDQLEVRFSIKQKKKKRDILKLLAKEGYIRPDSGFMYFLRRNRMHEK